MNKLVNMGAGGKRKGAGRKKLPVHLLKQPIGLSIENWIIDGNGGEEELKQKLYSFAKTEAGRQKNKNICTADD